MRKASRKPYQTKPKIVDTGVPDVVKIEGWTYVNAKTADHYVRLGVPGKWSYTIKTREPR